MDLGQSVSSRKWSRPFMRKLHAVVLYTLGALVFLLVIGYVAWRETERNRFVHLEAIISKSYGDQSSFRFSSKMIVWLNTSEPTTSIEHNEGAYVSDQNSGFIVHEITKTRVESLDENKTKTMTAERLMGGGDDWVRYHSIEPHTSDDNLVIGKWQDTADIMDDVLKNLPQEAGERIISSVAESLEYGNPLADPGMVFAFLKPELARWVASSYQKEHLRCYSVWINPKLMVDDDIFTFDFTGPGVGLDTLGKSRLVGTQLHSEYCWTPNNLIASMVTEAKKSGPNGFDFRKEVNVFQYNVPVDLPVPTHDNCQLEGEQHTHGCTWLS